jgi:hypothetical protein
MPAHKSLLLNVRIETARKLRRCKHNKKHSIAGGEKAIVVSSGQFDKKGYCLECGRKMIELTRTELDQLATDVTSG